MEILGLIDVPVWLLLTLLLVLALYVYTSKDHGYFKSVGIPGPKPKPFVGNTFDILFDEGFMVYDLNLKKKYGKVVGSFFPGNSRLVLVFDEEMLSEITVKKFQYFTNRKSVKSGLDIFDNNLLTMKDAEWKHTRSIMSPAFTTGKLRKMATEINRCAKQLTSIMASSEDFEAKALTQKFAMDVIASTAFGLRINSQEDGENEFVKNSNRFMKMNWFSPLIIISILFPAVGRFFNKIGLSAAPLDVVRFFEKVTRDTFENRKREGNSTRNDFVQLMVKAQAGEDIQDGNEQGTDQDERSTRQGGLSEKAIVSNAFLFFLAGFHTTSAGLRMLMYNLAINPECQDKLIEEVEQVIGDKDDVTYDMISGLDYLDKCLSESLRMYPPGPRADRVVKEDVTIGGVHFEKGTTVGVPIIAMQNDPDIWPEPKKFDPERFSPEQKAKRSPFHWMPFGYGPRNCIGMRLAIFEIKIAIVHMLKEHRIVKCEKTEVPLKFLKTKYLENKAGLWLKLEKRK